jgi:hypothetical protein
MKAYEYLLFLFLLLLCLLLTQYKRDGFVTIDDSFKQSVIFLKNEISTTDDPEKKTKIVNAINYINFIKTLF